MSSTPAPPSGAGSRSGLAGLSALTMRGRSFLAAGLTAVACALVLDQRDLLRVGVLLAAVPLGALLTTSRYRYRLALKRTIAPARVVAGTTARVGLELENLTRIPTRVLLAEDRVPYALGPSPRFVIARLPGRRRAAVTYTLRSEVRGRYALGPAAAADHRRVRDVRGRPLVHRRRPAGRRPEGVPARRHGRQRAVVGHGRVAHPQRGGVRRGRRRRPGSTATATTCAACTGARPPGGES